MTIHFLSFGKQINLALPFLCAIKIYYNEH